MATGAQNEGLRVLDDFVCDAIPNPTLRVKSGKQLSAPEAFVAFVAHALTAIKAKRFAVLASSSKGQRKALDALAHNFELAIRGTAVVARDYSKLWQKPCYGFHSRLGFGAEFSTVRQAYDELARDDSWLIIVQDASAGIHRPEGRWDAEKLIVGHRPKVQK